MLAVNDNLTAAEFKAGVDPNHRPAILVLPVGERTVFYEFVRIGRVFRLTRVGQTLVYPEMRHAPGPVFGSIATAGAPHQFCPPHQALPEATRNALAANKKAGRPNYIRGVVNGAAQPSDRPVPHLRAV